MVQLRVFLSILCKTESVCLHKFHVAWRLCFSGTIDEMHFKCLRYNNCSTCVISGFGDVTTGIEVFKHTEVARGSEASIHIEVITGNEVSIHIEVTTGIEVFKTLK